MGALPVIAGLFGLAIGSFLNVVIHRLPEGESIVTPASRCGACGAPIKPYDNVPVLSWLALRGRCRACAEPISARYPLVELSTGLLFAAVVWRAALSVEAGLALALVATLVPVALIDLEHRIIPNRILLPSAVAAGALLALGRPDALVEHAVAAAAAGGFFGAAALAYPAGMGMGDVKLAAVLGLYLGSAVVPAILAALLGGTVVGVGIMARKGVREGRKTGVPFGPFLALGGLAGLFAGDEVVRWYLDTFL